MQIQGDIGVELVGNRPSMNCLPVVGTRLGFVSELAMIVVIRGLRGRMRSSEGFLDG